MRNFPFDVLCVQRWFYSFRLFFFSSFPSFFLFFKRFWQAVIPVISFPYCRLTPVCLFSSDISKAFLQPSTDCHVKMTGDQQVLEYPDQPSGSNVTFKVTEIPFLSHYDAPPKLHQVVFTTSPCLNGPWYVDTLSVWTLYLTHNNPISNATSLSKPLVDEKCI